MFRFQATKLQLSDILSDQDILFSFMKFMKAEASVNVLQFYLSIGTLAMFGHLCQASLWVVLLAE